LEVEKQDLKLRRAQPPPSQLGIIDMNQTLALSSDLDANSPEVRHSAPTPGKAYARCQDFRKLFLENLDSLYQLCFLLTSDRDSAEECFRASLDECSTSQNVSKEWVHAWARRAIVQNAIRALKPRVNGTGSSYKPGGALEYGSTVKDGCFDLEAVLSLNDFERFAFVLSVLDQYSDWDCAVLLGCSVDDIRNARTLALGRLSASRRGAIDARLSERKLSHSNNALVAGDASFT
jgi:DNA-directed RNA polymerase specialized sigma24 family protein